MAFDYEALYRQQPNALGEPSKDFVRFFEAHEPAKARVLDLGCGQGRDALFIARRGHRVVAVDWSPSGIAQLIADAESEGLAVDGVVADLTTYTPSGAFDVVVLDRTLHMLAEAKRLDVLRRCLPVTTPRGFILIADEKRNLPAMWDLFVADRREWHPVFERRGALFVQAST
ncbi:MAG: class I SAM-dependent methyltransferase [Hyphomicrobiales bacterium]|nr:class I SAM-dependent methyltransferase [Hyphomicrobiales bacterium]